MANYYTLMTAQECVPCTQKDFEELQALLDPDNNPEMEWAPDLQLEYYTPGDDPADHGVYLYAEENFTFDEVPQAFWDRIGQLLTAAKKEYLQCGLAFTCDKMRPESHGGGVSVSTLTARLSSVNWCMNTPPLLCFRSARNGRSSRPPTFTPSTRPTTATNGRKPPAAATPSSATGNGCGTTSKATTMKDATEILNEGAARGIKCDDLKCAVTDTPVVWSGYYLQARGVIDEAQRRQRFAKEVKRDGKWKDPNGP